MSGNVISAVVPIRDGEEHAALWRIGHKTILEIAIGKLEAAVTGIDHVHVAGKGLEKVHKMFSGPGVSILDVDVPPVGEAYGDPLECIGALCAAVAGPVNECDGNDPDLVLLDPLRPLISASDLRTAVQGLHHQDPESLGRTGVVSVSRVRNHYHPKKVMTVVEDGGLVHFHEGGTKIYQRQQLQGDDYFVVDPAVAVIARCGAGTGWDPEGWVAVCIRDNGLRVENPETLELARALEAGPDLNAGGDP